MIGKTNFSVVAAAVERYCADCDKVSEGRPQCRRLQRIWENKRNRCAVTRFALDLGGPAMKIDD